MNTFERLALAALTVAAATCVVILATVHLIRFLLGA